MSTKKAVVTGGSGHLGRSFTARLLAEGWAVTGIDVRPGPGIVVGDVTRPGSWQRELRDADLVIHTAALLGDTGNARSHWEVHVHGTKTVFDACTRYETPRVVHLSTTAVLGTDFGDIADEDHPVKMTGNPYTDSKVASEHVALAHAARGLGVTIIRPGDVYGPNAAQWTTRVVKLIQRGLFTLVDGGTGLLSPVYVDDVTDGTITAATNPAARGEIFHLTGGSGVPAAEFFGRYAAMLGTDLRSLPRPVAHGFTAIAETVMRPLGVSPPFSGRAIEFMTRTGTYSIAKSATLLGWTPSVSLDDGMDLTRSWLDEEGLLTSPT